MVRVLSYVSLPTLCFIVYHRPYVVRLLVTELVSVVSCRMSERQFHQTMTCRENMNIEINLFT